MEDQEESEEGWVWEKKQQSEKDRRAGGRVGGCNWLLTWVLWRSRRSEQRKSMV